MAHFKQLSGYLDGLFRAETYEQQLVANAEQYAKEKIKEERSVGFQGSDDSPT